MLDKATQSPATTEIFSYTEVEAALSAVILGAADHRKRRTWLRSRIVRLRKLKIQPTGATQGRSSDYDRSWADRWLLGLLIGVKLGREPRFIAAMLRRHWSPRQPVSPALGQETLQQLCATARQMTDRDRHLILLLEAHGPDMTIAYVIGLEHMRTLYYALGDFRDARNTSPGIEGGAPVMVAVDLTALLTTLDRALAAARNESPLPSGPAGRILRAGQRARRSTA
jgi:hypothetical protein